MRRAWIRRIRLLLLLLVVAVVEVEATEAEAKSYPSWTMLLLARMLSNHSHALHLHHIILVLIDDGLAHFWDEQGYGRERHPPPIGHWVILGPRGKMPQSEGKFQTRVCMLYSAWWSSGPLWLVARRTSRGHPHEGLEICLVFITDFHK